MGKYVFVKPTRKRITCMQKENTINKKPKRESCPPMKVKIEVDEMQITCYDEMMEKNVESSHADSDKTKSSPQENRKQIMCYSKNVETSSDSSMAGSDKAKSTALLDRANEFVAKLPSDDPNFVKLMLPSQVSGGFWLQWPKDFCQKHMPKKDEYIVLLDENEKEYDIKYLAQKSGLSGGWRGFSIKHQLSKGDVLIFQLVDSNKFKFKVHIFKAKGGSRKLERDNGLLNSEGKVASEIAKDVKETESFNILWNGEVIDSEISEHVRSQYYQLCCSKKSGLHDGLVKCIDKKLAAGIISETVKIADAIRAAEITTTSCNDVRRWDQTLKGFEGMGMNVAFLRAAIKNILDSIQRKQQEKIKRKTNERAQAEKEMRNLETQLVNVKKKIRVLDDEINNVIRAQNEKHEHSFKEAAIAPS
ncbi:unnamed protein product [Coffea canephora]|uniref:TF-B3 domain-containing protein n=1 Tax=Coffea canephora TaxID=49390 RepID=A0A068V6G7_COFCA|nr:unnamed protein product [Coffea canephora]